MTGLLSRSRRLLDRRLRDELAAGVDCPLLHDRRRDLQRIDIGRVEDSRLDLFGQRQAPLRLFLSHPRHPRITFQQCKLLRHAGAVASGGLGAFYSL